MAEWCEGHIFVNVRDEASSKTMINAYAKLQCGVFFPHMMNYVLACKKYGASVAMVYFTPFTLMFKKTKTITVHNSFNML